MGIGEAIAHALAEQGAKLALVSRSEVGAQSYSCGNQFVAIEHG